MQTEYSRRIHLFEFNDTLLCPAFIRESLVEILGETLRQGRIYEPVTSIFVEFCKSNNFTSIVDLGSGSGEPVSILVEALTQQRTVLPKFYLTDLLPNEQSMKEVASRHPGVIDIIRVPVDATDIPEQINHQARTIITAFHHFRPEQASQILSDSVTKRKAIFILEPCSRNLICLFPLIVHGIIPVLTNPFKSKKNRLLKGVFTYLIPVIPVLQLWDGIISVLREYSEKDLMDMVEAFDGYDWNYYRLPVAPGGAVTVFTGVPN